MLPSPILTTCGVCSVTITDYVHNAYIYIILDKREVCSAVWPYRSVSLRSNPFVVDDDEIESPCLLVSCPVKTFTLASDILTINKEASGAVVRTNRVT